MEYKSRNHPTATVAFLQFPRRFMIGLWLAYMRSSKRTHFPGTVGGSGFYRDHHGFLGRMD